MPTIDVAMARSLHGGIWGTLRDSVVSSVTSQMSRRDVVADAEGKITDVKTAFSSWDNCMKADFCKWPVIAVMVVGGLILFSIIACIVRCACCAKSCCCSCFSCFKCCGNCCGCCDPPGDKKNKYLDEPFIPPNQGYRTQGPMHAPFPATTGVTGPPQYAEFETSKKGAEDSLPQMPSWEGANSKKVDLGEEAVEMNNLKSPMGRTDPNLPLMGGISPGPSSPLPHSPYGPPHPQGSSMMGGAMGIPRDFYAPQNRGPSNYHSEPDGYGLDQPYDMPPAGMPMAAPIMNGRNSPAPTHRTQPQQHPMDQQFTDMPNMPPGANDYGRNSPGPGAMGGSAMAGAAGYGMRRQNTGEAPYGLPRGQSPYGMNRSNRPMDGGNHGPVPYGMEPAMRNSPGPGPRRTPGPPADPYGRPPRGSPGPNSPGFGRPPYSPAGDNFGRGPPPDRHYSPSPRPVPQRAGHEPHRPVKERPYAQEEMPNSPITNNSGFDFNSGFSRPTTADPYDRRPSESREAPGREGYPGYKPYSSAQDGWSGV